MRRAALGLGLLWPLLLCGAASAQVQALVAQVSQANLMAHVAALEGDRSTPAAQAAAASYIRTQLEGFGYTVVSQPVGTSENLIATIVGSELPDDEFVLGAHFDSVAGSPGADDDASGVAAVLEVARILTGEPLRSTLHFAFFALEEAGIQGSEALAASFAAANANVIGMISLDMIGYTCSTPGCQIVIPDIPGCLETSGVSDVGDFIGTLVNTASASMLSGFLASIAAYEPSLPLESITLQGNGTCFPDSRRSDHKSFWDEGYPAMLLTDGAETRNPNYHQPTDTLATLDLTFMTSVTRAVLGQVADATLTPPAVPGMPLAGLWVLAGSILGVTRWARAR